MGDTLIVEEPEAHLHPAAQTEVAHTLARLVNAGVQVVVTTHSDRLLKEFGNLIREGEFNEKTGSFVDESSANNVSFPIVNGGPCWNRTNDHLIKSQMLYRLS